MSVLCGRICIAFEYVVSRNFINGKGPCPVTISPEIVTTPLSCTRYTSRKLQAPRRVAASHAIDMLQGFNSATPHLHSPWLVPLLTGHSAPIDEGQRGPPSQPSSYQTDTLCSPAQKGHTLLVSLARISGFEKPQLTEHRPPVSVKARVQKDDEICA